MKEYPNFYETPNEASMRLLNTIVMYDDEPYYVIGISNHKPDGIYRMYLDFLGNPQGCVSRRASLQEAGWPFSDYTGHPSLGAMADEWLEKNKDKGVIRKMMNSPSFNKFRPFPLGMCNQGGQVSFIERQPTRHTQQGLTSGMLSTSFLHFSDPNKRPMLRNIDMFSYSFYETIKGKYPDANECLKNLLDPDITNTGAAFHRLFALVRGPMDLLFLAYKGDLIGYLPNGDFSVVKLDKKCLHCREVVTALQLFESVK